MKPLYNHSSEQTAYLVEDYPYGGLRCQIRYWIEKTNRGFRFYSQTKNPKTGMWNSPKRGTYAKFAACMFLDEKNHVTWNCITEHSQAKDALNFIKNFPQSDMSQLLIWSIMKATYNKAYADGKVYFEVNGKRIEESTQSLEEHFQESEMWRECIKLIKASRSEKANENR